MKFVLKSLNTGVWKILENSVSKVPTKIPVTRPVRCMVSYKEKLYFGDDGVNIKVFDFKSESLDKLKNHENGLHSSSNEMLGFFFGSFVFHDFD